MLLTAKGLIQNQNFDAYIGMAFGPFQEIPSHMKALFPFEGFKVELWGQGSYETMETLFQNRKLEVESKESVGCEVVQNSGEAFGGEACKLFFSEWLKMVRYHGSRNGEQAVWGCLWDESGRGQIS